MNTLDPFALARLLELECDAVPVAAAPRLMAAKKEKSPAPAKPELPKKPEGTGDAPDALARAYREDRSGARALMKELKPGSLEPLRALDD
jgi:hypothetical protein